MLLKLGDDVIGDGVPFLLGQALLEAAHHLAGAYQGVGKGVAEHVASGHALKEHNKND